MTSPTYLLLRKNNGKVLYGPTERAKRASEELRKIQKDFTCRHYQSSNKLLPICSTLSTCTLQFFREDCRDKSSTTKSSNGSLQKGKLGRHDDCELALVFNGKTQPPFRVVLAVAQP